MEDRKSRIRQYQEMFREYDYDAHRKYQMVSEDVRASKAQLMRLKKAQEDNQEYLELNELDGRLSRTSRKQVRAEYNAKLREKSGQDATVIQRSQDKIEEKSAELGGAGGEDSDSIRIQHYAIVRQTVEAYERYLENGRKGPGGLLAEEDQSERITSKYRTA